MLALLNEFRASYLDVNGLGLLQDESEEKRLTVRNDNGVLFASMGYTMFREYLGDFDRQRMRETLTLLRASSGLFNRRPNDLTPEAHDNYDGIIVLDFLSGGKVGLEICAYGEAHGWQFSNQKPEKFSWTQLRQGGSVAFYKIQARLVPYPLEALWLWGGMIYGMAFGWASTFNLAWMKMEVLPEMLAREQNIAMWSWVKWGTDFTIKICQFIDLIKSRFPLSFVNYFGEKHIITRAARLKYKT